MKAKSTRYWRDPQPDDARYVPRTPPVTNFDGTGAQAKHDGPELQNTGHLGIFWRKSGRLALMHGSLWLIFAFCGYMIGDWRLTRFQDEAVPANQQLRGEVARLKAENAKLTADMTSTGKALSNAESRAKAAEEARKAAEKTRDAAVTEANNAEADGIKKGKAESEVEIKNLKDRIKELEAQVPKTERKSWQSLIPSGATKKDE